MQFGPLPEKRAVPDFVRVQSQEELALKLLRQRQELDEAHREEVRALEKRLDRMAEQLAIITHKKRFTEKDPLVLSLRQLLKREGIELVTYAGEPVTEELEDQADIVEWLPATDDPEDRVVDALEPEVHFQGRLLHRAKLSCRMGAQEPEEAPEPEAVSAEADVAPEMSDGAQAEGAQSETASAQSETVPVQPETVPTQPETVPAQSEAAKGVPPAAAAPVPAPSGPKHAHGRKNTRKNLRRHKKKANQRKH